MADNLKSEWKETGKEIGHAFKGLGKTLVKTAKKGVDKADSWASGDSKAKETPVTEEPKSESEE